VKLLTAAVGGVPGELVVPIMACDTPRCGCGRGFIGMSSGELVSVAVVADLEMSTDDLRGIIEGYLARTGWGADPELLADLAEELRDLADWPTGTRVRRTGDEVRPI
jgi:hypothetical protein